MARINTAVAPIYTHEGAKAKHIGAYDQLRRSVLSCFLWEKEFYEDGLDITTRIQDTANKVSEEDVAALAVEARTVHGLRHVSLWLVLNLIRRRSQYARKTIVSVVNRADEVNELLAMYWAGKRTPISRQLYRGLRDAFLKFDEYQLAKYNRDVKVKLKDVMRMVRPDPRKVITRSVEVQTEIQKRLNEDQLAIPNTWEVRISAIPKTDTKERKKVWEDLINTGQLGYMALLRNLRNMQTDGVDPAIINAAIIARKGARWVLPFRYTAAARQVPQFEKAIDTALLAAIDHLPVLPGRTVIAIDTSGSMGSPLSAKSDMRRVDAAATLASMINGTARVIIFADRAIEIAYRRGMAGVDNICGSIGKVGHGTNIGSSIALADSWGYDRLIVITDEQSRTPVSNPKGKCYMINVASAKNGVGYGGNFVHIDGFSENVIRFIAETEGIKTENNPSNSED